MNKVEFKKNFDIGYEEILFSANNDKTIISIKNKYSVPSSMVTSTITKIAGTLYDEKKWGWIFSDLIEIDSDINAELEIELNRFEIDEEDFDEEAFLDHLIEQAAYEIRNSNYFTVLKKMIAI